MHELHFSTIDLRNKLSRGRVNNNHPIIAQVMGRENMTTTAQVRVDIYPLMQSCWREIRGFLHKEMNLRIKSAYYEALNKNDIYPPWAIAFQPPPNLMSNQRQIDTIMALRKNQAKEMLMTLSRMSNHEADECKNCADVSTQALRTYYQQVGAAQYNLNEALDALVTLTDRSQKTVHAEQQKGFIELSNKPTLAWYTGFPEQLIPSEIKKIRDCSLFCLPQERSQSRPTQGGQRNQKINFQTTRRRHNQGPRVATNKRGNPNAQKIKKILQLLNL